MQTRMKAETWRRWSTLLRSHLLGKRVGRLHWQFTVQAIMHELRDSAAASWRRHYTATTGYFQHRARHAVAGWRVWAAKRTHARAAGEALALQHRLWTGGALIRAWHDITEATMIATRQYARATRRRGVWSWHGYLGRRREQRQQHMMAQLWGSQRAARLCLGTWAAWASRAQRWRDQRSQATQVHIKALRSM